MLRLAFLCLNSLELTRRLVGENTEITLRKVSAEAFLMAWCCAERQQIFSCMAELALRSGTSICMMRCKARRMRVIMDAL